MNGTAAISSTVATYAAGSPTETVPTNTTDASGDDFTCTGTSPIHAFHKNQALVTASGRAMSIGTEETYP